ncbi:hypothetical protein ACF3OJ_03075 [Cardiobacterium hominis]|uniref:hypothetical protein n=1 Tax=Cardiobacterium hominis TaxID=2718 RepID=UPI00370D07EF
MMTEHIVHVPPKTIGKEELAELLGVAVATIEKRPAQDLPPPIAGYKNRWYYPVVDRWLMERSQFPGTQKRKPAGF